MVARAQPDGYTLLLTGDMLVANQTLFKNNVNYDAERSFAPVGIVAVTPPVIVVRADSDIQDIAGLRRLGSQRLVNVGTPGPRGRGPAGGRNRCGHRGGARGGESDPHRPAARTGRAASRT
ncbi:hypothetical protein G6F57_022531 [Rhizopus arrhizus]|nr:hypothetical protein G6F57_022531 [Rhizopus arrhizus]